MVPARRARPGRGPGRGAGRARGAGRPRQCAHRRARFARLRARAADPGGRPGASSHRPAGCATGSPAAAATAAASAPNRARRRSAFPARSARSRRGMPAKTSETDRSASSSARLARRPRLGRTTSRRRLRRDDQCDDRLAPRSERNVRRLAGAGQVAGPPARLGEVHEALVVERAATGHLLELGTSELQRSEPGGGGGATTRSMSRSRAGSVMPAA